MRDFAVKIRDHVDPGWRKRRRKRWVRRVAVALLLQPLLFLFA